MIEKLMTLLIGELESMLLFDVANLLRVALDLYLVRDKKMADPKVKFDNEISCGLFGYSKDIDKYVRFVCTDQSTKCACYIVYSADENGVPVGYFCRDFE